MCVSVCVCVCSESSEMNYTVYSRVEYIQVYTYSWWNAFEIWILRWSFAISGEREELNGLYRLYRWNYYSMCYLLAVYLYTATSDVFIERLFLRDLYQICDKSNLKDIKLSVYCSCCNIVTKEKGLNFVPNTVVLVLQSRNKRNTQLVFV